MLFPITFKASSLSSLKSWSQSMGLPGALSKIAKTIPTPSFFPAQLFWRDTEYATPKYGHKNYLGLIIFEKKQIQRCPSPRPGRGEESLSLVNGTKMNLRNKPYWTSLSKGTLLSVMWQPGWEGSLGEDGYMYMYGLVPSMLTWSYHNIVNQLYSNTK